MNLNEHIECFKTNYTGLDPSLFGRLQFWADALGNHELTDINADMIDGELRRLIERGAIHNRRGAGVVVTGKPLSGATINRYRAALASVIKHSKQKRLVRLAWQSPVRDVPAEQESAGRLEYLTIDQVEALVLHARAANWKKLPALILMAFTTGLRRGALEGLRWRDISFIDGTATIARVKNGEPHVASLTPRLLAELRKFESKDSNELVFSGTKGTNHPHNFRVCFQRALEAAELPIVTFHALRHSTASHLAKAGVPLLQIADVMSHKSISMTKRYSHLCIKDRANVIATHFG